MSGSRRVVRPAATRRGLVVASVLALVASWVSACSPSPDQPAGPAANPDVHLVTPAPDTVTLYLSMPYGIPALDQAATAAASPGAGYRRFQSVAEAGNTLGATDADITRVVDSIGTLGLGVAVDPSRLFARVYATPAQWATALGEPMTRQAAATKNPFTTYALRRRLPDALTPSGTQAAALGRTGL